MPPKGVRKPMLLLPFACYVRSRTKLRSCCRIAQIRTSTGNLGSKQFPFSSWTSPSVVAE
eukprot:4045695-Amphidinium_carterae.2